MRTRNVDTDWDWQFGHGQSDYKRNIYSVELDIQMRLKEWLNDCYFNLAQGIAWQVRLGSKNQQDLLDQEVMSTVQSVEGVLSVYNFTSNVVNRKYTCQFDVYTSYSTNAITINFEG